MSHIKIKWLFSESYHKLIIQAGLGSNLLGTRLGQGVYPWNIHSINIPFLKLIFIGVELLYNVVLASTAQQNESARHIHLSPPFWISLPCRTPQCIKQSSLCYTLCSHQLSILYIVSILYMCQSQSPNSSHPTPFPLGIHTFVLYICVSISAWQMRSASSISGAGKTGRLHVEE